MSADAARDVPLGREIGVHRGASWRIETDSISGRAGKRLCETASRSRLCRCGVPSGDFGIGVVTQGSDRPLDKALWAEIEIDEIAAYTIAQTLPEPMANSAIRKRQAKGSRVALGRSLSACWAAEE